MKRRIIVGPFSLEDQAEIEATVAQLRRDIAAQQQCDRIQALIRRHIWRERIRRWLPAIVALVVATVALAAWRLMAGGA